jgi:hypothetical protein
VVLAEAPDGPHVAVAPHDVTFDEHRKVWVCDIDLEAGAAFLPFVRLACARYQPQSVEGVHLSPVVVRDFVQLLPDRKATVAISGDGVEVEVVGESADNIMGSGADRQPAGVVMSAAVELQPTELTGDLGWVPIGEAVRLTASAPVDGVRTWKASVPLADAPSGFRRRLLVTEHEWFPADLGVDEGDLSGRPAASRLVYADAFDL